MDRPIPQPGEIWRHYLGKQYEILAVESGRVEYEPLDDESMPSSDVSLDYFLGVSDLRNVNRFEFVSKGDRV